MLTELGNDVVTVIPRTKVKHGDYVEGDPVDYPGCNVQPVDSTEQLLSGAVVQERWRLWAPLEFPKKSENVILHDEIRMHVDGNLQTWKDLDGNPCYVTGLLKRFTG